MTTNSTGDLRSAGVVQVLDVGCGVASFSAYLLPLDIHTMSFAPKDGHENQIQFALERGIGAMISVLATKQLPYPGNSFEMVHCSRCRVDWHENGKIHILLVFMLSYGAFQNLRCDSVFMWGLVSYILFSVYCNKPLKVSWFA